MVVDNFNPINYRFKMLQRVFLGNKISQNFIVYLFFQVNPQNSLNIDVLLLYPEIQKTPIRKCSYLNAEKRIKTTYLISKLCRILFSEKLFRH